MPIVNFIDQEDNQYNVEGNVGTTIMEIALANNVPGIDADCGGACACATCHVYVENDWLEKLSPQDDMEASMLEFAEEVQPNSRLSCQIQLSDELDGITLKLPVSQ